MYDVTLNFKDNQTPTLLGIVNGKKYKADMSVRSVALPPAAVSGLLIRLEMSLTLSWAEVVQLLILSSVHQLLILKI